MVRGAGLVQTPEMARRDLAGAVLQLKALGVDSLAEFDFPAPPPPQLAAKAVEALHVLAALDSEARCRAMGLTPVAVLGLQYLPAFVVACSISLAAARRFNVLLYTMAQ